MSGYAPKKVVNDDLQRKDYEYPDSAIQRIIQTVFDLIIIIIVFAIFVCVYFLQNPKIRYFTCDESDVFYPFIVDTIPFWAVIIYGVTGPLILIISVEMINANLFSKHKNKINVKSFFICMFHAISLFTLGIAIVLLLTEIAKRWIGRLRPHFMDVCKPDFTKFNCTYKGTTGFIYNQISTDGDFCTGDPGAVLEARLSFPSGHSSFSWYTMLFSIIYLEARFVSQRLKYIKIFIQMACFIAAFVTMLSRVTDNYHRPTDVIGGTILGCTVALSITLFVGRLLWISEPNAAKENRISTTRMTNIYE